MLRTMNSDGIFDGDTLAICWMPPSSFPLDKRVTAALLQFNAPECSLKGWSAYRR
jgi:hypothetical protein